MDQSPTAACTEGLPGAWGSADTAVGALTGDAGTRVLSVQGKSLWQ